MDNKIKLFLDFDDTLTLSAKQFVKLANSKFNLDKKWEDYKNWNFADIYPNITLKDINEIFCSKDFFVDLEPCEQALQTLSILNDSLELHIVTIGKEENLNLKTKWLDCHINFMDYKFTGIIENKIYDKSCVDMSNSIFIDDRIDNIRTTNASIKILYRNNKNYSWQKIEPNENIYVVDNWKQIYDILCFYIQYPNLIKENNIDV